jgi:hypothetical protein
MSDRAPGPSQPLEPSTEKGRLIAAVPEDFRAELHRILSGGTLGPHIGTLLAAVQDGRPNLRELLRYGMERLPSDDLRPDDTLATYFMVLSELGQCSRELRIFATKCVEYCESDALDGWSESLAELYATYYILVRGFD